MPAAAADAQPLRVLTYNIQGNLNEDISMASIASVISGQNADVVGLQEACANQVDDLKSRLPAYPYARHVVTVPMTKTHCVNYGIAILSKLPLADYTATELPTHNEKRFVQSATITAGGLPVRFFNTHLSPGAGATHVNAIAAETDKPGPERKIVVGDFNVEQDDAALNSLWARSFVEADWSSNTPTHPSSNPSKKIDFVFLGGAVAGGATSVPSTTASDHRPLRADVTLVIPPARPPTRIVFESARSGGGDIYRAAPSGANLRRLTTHGAQDYDPVASPDGSQIAFVSRRDGDAELFIMNADGEASGLRQLTHNGSDDLEPTWSDDGVWIAYRSTRHVNGDNNNEIYKIRAADGQQDTRLTNNAASDFAPDWSPTGGVIAFQRHTSGVGNEVYTMTDSGTSPTNRTNNDGPNDGRPAFSPDGQKLAFHSNRAGVSFEIFTMDWGGASIVRRTAARADDQEPVWSPDGSQLAYRSDRTGNNDLITGDIVGGVLTSGFRVTADGASEDSPDWYTDTRAPQTDVDGPSGTIETSSPQFTFTRDEAEGTFECSLDGAEWAACTSPYTTVALPDGPHGFRVRGVDWAGNRDATPATRDVVVDAVKPTVTVTGAPPALGADASPQVAFDTAGATSVTCAIDGAAAAPCTSPLALGPLEDGDHEVVLRAADGEGNTDSETVAFAVDTTAPGLTIDAEPAALGNDASPEVRFTATGESGVTCALNGAAAVPCASPLTLGPLDDGDHELVVRAADAAGNSTTRTVAFATDTVAPDTTLGAVGSPLADATPEFTFGGGDRHECRVDGGAWFECESPHVAAELDQGAHTFAVRAHDLAGNVDDVPATASFVVDTVDPTLTIDAAPPALGNDATPSVAFSASETVEATCTLDGEAAVPCTSPYAVPEVADGEHELVIAATDAAGNQAEPETVAFTVDTQAPVVGFTGGPTGAIDDTTPTFAFSADDDTATFACAIDDGDFEACSSPLTTAALKPGPHEARVRATDAAGNVSAVVSRAFSVNFPAEPPPGGGPPAPPAPPPDPPKRPSFVVGFDEYKSAPGASSSSTVAAITLVTRRAKADKRGRVRLTVACRVACRGTLTVGKAREAFRAAAGKRVTVTVTLDAATRARLRRAKRSITASVRLPGGTKATLTLRRR